MFRGDENGTAIPEDIKSAKEQKTSHENKGKSRYKKSIDKHRKDGCQRGSNRGANFPSCHICLCFSICDDHVQKPSGRP